MRYLLCILVTFTLIGCGDFGELAPPMISIEELALTYEKTIGEEVFLVGYLRRDREGQYLLVQRPPNIESNYVKGFQLQLSFSYDNVDDSLMERCLGETTTVTGYVEADHRIEVKSVWLDADVHNWQPDYCYETYQ